MFVARDDFNVLRIGEVFAGGVSQAQVVTAIGVLIVECLALKLLQLLVIVFSFTFEPLFKLPEAICPIIGADD